ncbi:NIT2 [Candida jiufengensis]|uniref:NIT2 n=1 Tax=Candida jiufengensis TaxID=497108 RepID=UPI002225521E|nr:NIT2 [Candida jiufengensis]KAI5957341.1 NIT2 [Candida jiufengensis]
MKIAVGQLCSSSNLQKNLQTVKKIISKAIENQTKILFLPEATDYISQNAQHSIELSKTVNSNFLTPLLNHIKDLQNSPYISIGIHLPSTTKEKVSNINILINPKGEIISKYQKLHLFDVDVPQGPILKESNSVEAGKEIIEPIKIPNTLACIGLAICYDIRFPELALKLRQKGANIITFPSAFTTKTGDAHWETLTKARALDTQSFIINAAQCGKHNVGTNDKGDIVERISYGDSIIVDGWGKVLNRGQKYNELSEDDIKNSDEYFEIIYADLDFENLEKIRTNMPLLNHRRSDVLGEL